MDLDRTINSKVLMVLIVLMGTLLLLLGFAGIVEMIIKDIYPYGLNFNPTNGIFSVVFICLGAWCFLGGLKGLRGSTRRGRIQ